MKFPWFFLIVLFLVSISSASPLSVHFFDVGQGDSALIEHDGHIMLINAGDLDAGPTVLPYFRSLGITSLDVMVSSHPHTDHIGGMVDVLNAMPVDLFVDNGATHTAPAYKDLMKILVKKQTPYATAKKGDAIPFTDDVKVQVTNPGILSDDLNEDSLALLLTYGDVRIFFPGDCVACDASADVVKLAHHGSKGSATRGILNKDKPTDIVISLAEDNEYHYPAPSTMNALTKAGVTVHRTDLDGTIVLKTDGKRYWFE
ncbi:ComEC/Rec2 family competence protein [Methanospirillum sp.]